MCRHLAEGPEGVTKWHGDMAVQTRPEATTSLLAVQEIVLPEAGSSWWSSHVEIDLRGNLQLSLPFPVRQPGQCQAGLNSLGFACTGHDVLIVFRRC